MSKYKPGPQIFIADWLSRNNHEMNWDKKVPSVHITINAIESCTDIPSCMTAEETRKVTLEHGHLSALAEFILNGWPSMKNCGKKRVTALLVIQG